MSEKTDLDYFQKIFNDADVSYERRTYQRLEGGNMNDIGYALILHSDTYKVVNINSIPRSTFLYFTFNKKLDYVELS